MNISNTNSKKKKIKIMVKKLPSKKYTIELDASEIAQIVFYIKLAVNQINDERPEFWVENNLDPVESSILAKKLKEIIANDRPKTPLKEPKTEEKDQEFPQISGFSSNKI